MRALGGLERSPSGCIRVSPCSSMVTLNWPGTSTSVAVVHAERLPVFGGESEARHAPDDALGVDAQREFEVFVDFAEHLPGVDDLDGLLFQSEIVAQRQDATHVDAGHERAAEIHRNPVRLPMIQGAKYALSAGGFRHVSRLTDLLYPMPSCHGLSDRARTGRSSRDINRLLSETGVSSRDRLRTALKHREPDRIPLDFGSTAVTGIHVSCVAALRDYYGLAQGPVKVHEPYQMLGLVEDDLRAAMGLDVTGVFPRKTMFGFPAADWKEWNFRRSRCAGARRFPDQDRAERRHPDLSRGR